MRNTGILAALIVTLWGTGVSAHPPGADGHHEEGHHNPIDPSRMRTWTNPKTGETVRGAFLAARTADGGMRISIERDNGDVVVFPLADLAASDRAEAQRRIDEVRLTNERLVAEALAETASPPATLPAAPAQAVPFNAFSPFVSTRWDERWLYIECDGLPHTPGSAKGTYIFSHPMMVGITAWQQQVPLPQSYRGSNAWQIPLKPEMATKPVSAKEQLFRGAIALAANGVPIFNPIKNDGRTDTLLAGELDDFGGHCGRADDYHYHIAPTHLQKYVGAGQPIAYALDGFPIYNYFDADAKPNGPHEEKCCPLGGTEKLDELNGHYGAAPPGSQPGTRGTYHYHASLKYPYLNGGMRGVVNVKDDQIDPQPRANSPRAALPPLRGARITGFKAIGAETDPAWSLEYLLTGKKHFVNYRGENGKWIFDFVDAAGATKTDTYDATNPQRRQGGGGGRQPRNARDDDERPRRGDATPPPANPASPPNAPAATSQDTSSRLSLSSVDVVNGRLAIECTCDGTGRAPALAWNEPPTGTKALAVVMHHVPPEGGAHVYMVVGNIPATVRGLDSGTTTPERGKGIWGQNTVNRRKEYAPPCSQGPGDKAYTITLFALSSEAKINSETPLTREALLSAIKDTTLATATLEVKYARAESGDRQDRPRRGAGSQDEGRRGGDPDGPGRREGRGANDEQPRSGGRGRERGGLIAQMTAFKTDVPAHPFNIVLANPTHDSMTVTVVCHETDACEGYIEYRHEQAAPITRSTMQPLPTGKTVPFVLEHLSPDTPYTYRFRYRRVADGKSPAGEFRSSGYYGFWTPRDPGGAFTFVIQADSHLDQGVEPKAYAQTLANMLEAKPDFVIDLGDTFMTDKRGRDFAQALPQYDAQRYYFGLVAHSAPLFMVLGNHDGEKGTSGTNDDDIGPWSYAQRTSRFPPPVIDGTNYTGSTGMKDGVGSNYYAFVWGDAQIIVLDPYWSTSDRVRGGGGGNRGREGGDGQRAPTEPLNPTDASWSMTLGRTQYDWLSRTLESTKAKYRFVFIHHLVGGMGGAESRGGVEASPYFEWGGKNADGTPGFAQHRAGWPMPIHELLVKHRVSAVFHGHDHLYVSNQRGGVVYQCVPQPGNLRGNTRTASQYGYTSGTLHGSPGHIRVRVASEKASVEFVRTSLAAGDPDNDTNENGRGNQDRRGGGRDANGRGEGAGGVEPNGAIVHSHTIAPGGTASPPAMDSRP